MKSYLSLVPISAKVHRRQNRMTLLCIMIAVFLVTTVFSMADMVIRTEKIRMINHHGNWHIQIENLSERDTEQIKQRLDISLTAWYDVINDNASKAYYIKNKKVALYGVDEVYMTKIMDGLSEGSYPKNNHEIILSTNIKKVMDIQIGDSIIINTPAGNRDYIVSGFGEDDVDMFQAQTYLMGAYMTRAAFQEILTLNHIENPNPRYYVQFKEQTNISKAISDIKKQYGMENISENTGLLGMMGNSSNSSMKNIYTIAVILFVLVALAGVFMISGSMNSNITQRIKFFGMLRCIGASKQQIIRFVRLEALNWCKIAIPIGIVFSIFITWGVCAALRFGIGGEFAEIPLFGLSAVGMLSGMVVGIATVLLAAQAPAKRAASVSPVTAVTGGAERVQTVQHAAVVCYAKVETSLGVYHAVSARKNLILMTGSFALSIILILSFSVGLNFARALLPSLRAWQPDLSVVGYKNAPSLDRDIVNEIKKISGVKNVYGNLYKGDILVSSNKNTIDHVSLVSYDEYMLSCAKKSIIDGNLSKVYGDSNVVLTIYNKNNPIKVGDKIKIEDTEIEVVAALSDGLFADDVIVICSENTFTRLIGEQNYSMISVQLTNGATDETVKNISEFANKNHIFSDLRNSNRESNATYWATRLLGYSFLVIVGMITVLYIINSISMSVSARIRQYGVMRAIGMDGRQLTKMVAAEAFTYATLGYVVGCAIGLPLSKFFYFYLVTKHFGDIWEIPVFLLGIILVVVFAATIVAIYTPSKRIRDMAVTDIINEL